MGDLLFPWWGKARIVLFIGFGTFLGFTACLSWSVFFYGPQQRKIGGREMAETLTAATNEASRELSNAAESHRLNSRVCRASGGVYSNVSGECER
jgi:hypothetical protein